MANADSISQPMPAWRLAALAAYPVIILLALMLDQPQLRALGLPVLAVAVVGPLPDSTGSKALLLGSVMLAALVMVEPALALWPPGLICLAVASWFGLSLLPGREPRIQQFAACALAMHDRELPDNSDGWLRGWTLLWTLMLSAYGLVTLSLAMTDRVSLWMFWVFLVMPLLMVTLLLSEHYLRRLRFPDQPRWTAAFFLRTLARIQPRQFSS